MTFWYRKIVENGPNTQYYICLYFIVASKIFFSCKVKEPVVRTDGVDLYVICYEEDYIFYFKYILYKLYNGYK